MRYRRIATDFDRYAAERSAREKIDGKTGSAHTMNNRVEARDESFPQLFHFARSRGYFSPLRSVVLSTQSNNLMESMPENSDRNGKHTAAQQTQSQWSPNKNPIRFARRANADFLFSVSPSHTLSALH